MAVTLAWEIFSSAAMSLVPIPRPIMRNTWNSRSLSRSTGATASFSGYIGDVRHNRKRLAFIGYSASVAYKVLLVFSASVGVTLPYFFFISSAISKVIPRPMEISRVT